MNPLSSKDYSFDKKKIIYLVNNKKDKVNYN